MPHKYVFLTPEQIALKLLARADLRTRGLELPDPPVPGPKWFEILDEAISNPVLYTTLQTGRALGFEGKELCHFMIMELAKINKRIWAAFLEAQDKAPTLWRLGPREDSPEEE